MKKLKPALVLTGVLISILITGSAFADKAEKDGKKVVIVFSAERKGNFLSEPGNVPIEFLRRAGREINKTWTPDQKELFAASLFSTGSLDRPDFLKPINQTKLSSEQKKDAQALLNRYSSEADELIQEIKIDENCLHMRMAAETAPFLQMLNEMIAKPEAMTRINETQLFKLKHQLIPILEVSDFLIGSAVLSDKGFEARFRIKSLENKLANPKISHALSIGKFINPEALMVFAQTHAIEDPAETMASLREIPQSTTVISMVASAGLDFEKDLLANSARESVLYLNLEPSGEGGVPDIRFIAPVPDIKKFENNLDKFKNLCMQTGIFVKPLDGKCKGVRLSHFMFPQYGIFAGMRDRFMVLASSEENLNDEIEFLEQATQNKAQIEEMESGLQRYWRIRFDDFNLQLQKFLQSPLMADKGIPPIPNISMFDDLSDLKVTTRLHSDRIDISLIVPLKEKKEK